MQIQFLVISIFTFIWSREEKRDSPQCLQTFKRLTVPLSGTWTSYCSWPGQLIPSDREKGRNPRKNHWKNHLITNPNHQSLKESPILQHENKVYCTERGSLLHFHKLSHVPLYALSLAHTFFRCSVFFPTSFGSAFLNCNNPGFLVSNLLPWPWQVFYLLIGLPIILGFPSPGFNPHNPEICALEQLSMTDSIWGNIPLVLYNP